jgi:predicted ATPase/class 3 adenylate cyclase
VSEVPSGTVTFLFTDLENSTRLWEEHPEAMKVALTHHDEIVRSAIESRHGHVVKATGDGFHGAFHSAHDAFDAALDAQVALSSETWREMGPLRVRMGIHTGESQERDGDYFGPAVNRAARLMSVAHGGQVLVSLSTEELLRDRLPEGVSLVDLGDHRLRDLSRAERVFQVEAEGLAHGFPPIRTVDAYPGNLPAQLTSFVGRGDEVVAVAKALEASRLVTITGTGGVGKTRLAVQLAAEIVQRFPDGVWVCELAAAEDPDAMFGLIAAALGVTHRQGLSLAESINEFLGHKDLLLLLDNCEHLLLDVGRFVEAVMRHCAGVRILATSREGLGAVGEQVWPLRSLDTADYAVSRELAGHSDAVELFADRARAARPDFMLDPATTPVVAEICRRLDGIPLAIELAAARTVALSPSDIAALLDERFRLLTGGRRTAIERHQTLRATVDWSYSLLEDVERLVFDRLGVFAGSFDTAGATAVVTGDGIEAFDVVDALTGLVGKSMVVAEPRTDGPARFQLLETMRQYAREQLDHAGEPDRWRRQLVEYCAVFAEQAGAGSLSRDEFVWRAHFYDELDNIRAAVAWSLDRTDQDDTNLALRVISALVFYSVFDSPRGMGVWAQRALPKLESASPQLRYAVTAAAAWQLLSTGDYEGARELARLALADGVPAGSSWPAAGHMALGIATALLGDPESAIALSVQAVRALDASTPDSPDACWLHNTIAFFGLWAGSPVAQVEAEHALRIARDLANPTLLTTALYAWGWALTELDLPAARAALEESIAYARQGASPVVFGPALFQLAVVETRAGETDQAASTLREAIERCHEAGDRSPYFTSVWCGVEILAEHQRYRESARFAGIASQGLGASFLTELGWRTQQAALEHVRHALGDAVFEAEFSRGATMTYDDSLEHTLRTLSELTGDA